MYTSILLFALAPIAPAVDPAPSWQTDYPAARKIGAAEKKPVAVILAPGRKGWQKLSQDGSLSKEVRRILADKYVCVHIDTTNADGKSLAEDFEMAGGLCEGMSPVFDVIEGEWTRR